MFLATAYQTSRCREVQNNGYGMGREDAATPCGARRTAVQAQFFVTACYDGYVVRRGRAMSRRCRCP